MPAQVLYEIPYATGPLRVVMGGVCLLFLAGIYGWWAPRVVPALLKAPATAGQKVFNTVIAILPLLIGIGPAAVLIGLIANPIAYVTDRGVTKEAVLSKIPVSFAWADIARVTCRVGRNGVPVSIAFIANDGRRIELGNTGGVDFASLLELIQNQLGPNVVNRCVRSH